LGVTPGTYRRNGAFAEYYTLPRHILYKIPDNISSEQAAMVEAVAVALHGILIFGVILHKIKISVSDDQIYLFFVYLMKLSLLIIINE
jgi:threonine dehydrogenase-like Zn-dependent dehydrogenase